jgi:hypothetical protein
MFRHHEYACALETFRDAVQAMKFATETGIAKQQQVLDDELSNAQQRASRRTATLATSSIDNSRTASPMEVISTQEDSAAVLSIISVTLTSTRMYFPILIDPIDDHSLSGTQIDDGSIELESSIMIRNYGLAHAALASNMTELGLQKTHLDRSYRLFTLAKAAVYRIQEEYPGAVIHENVLLFELLLSYDLLQTSIQLKMDNSWIVEHSENYQYIISWIRSHSGLIATGCKAAPAA